MPGSNQALICRLVPTSLFIQEVGEFPYLAEQPSPCWRNAKFLVSTGLPESLPDSTRSGGAARHAPGVRDYQFSMIFIAVGVCPIKGH